MNAGRAIEERQHRIVESATDFAIITTDLSGRVIGWNSGAELLLGYPEAEIHGEMADVIFTPEDRAAGAPETERRTALRDGRAEDERWHMRRDGSRFWGSGTLMTLKDSGGGVVGFVKIMRDRTAQRETEQALAASNRRLRLAIEASRLAVWDLDVATDTLVASPELNRIMGFPPEARPTAEDTRRNYAPGEMERLRALGAEALDRGERLLEYEFRYIRPDDGAERWLLLRAEIQVDASGTPVRAVGILIDIDERKRSQLVLQETEERFRLIADSAPVMLWMGTSTGKCLYLNAALRAFWGVAEEDIPGFDWTPTIHPDDLQALAGPFGEGMRTQTGFSVEARYRRADGEYRILQTTTRPRFDSSGKFLGMTGVNLDVTEQRRAEAELQSLNATLETRVTEALAERQVLADIVESANAGVMACDLDYRILAINKANAAEFERVYGKRPKVGDNLLELLAHLPEHQAQVARHWGRALAGEEFVLIEEFGDTVHERVAFEVRFSVLRDRDGRRVGASQTAYDVSDRLRDQAELEQAREALRQSQKMEAMGQLTGGVAHDFNNLLTPIVGSLDRLQRKGVGDERDRRLIDGAMQSAERAATLVQRLLAFARRQPLRAAAVEVGALIHGMAELVASTSGPRVRVELDIAPDLPPALADANQLEMALLNLAVNARDAMPEGGALTIAAATDEVGPHHRSKLTPGRYVRLSVADTGTGMSPDVLARAIEPFFSTKGIGKGTGLGLSMVHGLAAQLGGALAIASKPGLGTTVELWLPASEAAASQAYDTSRPTPAAGAGTVLLVDDEELVRASTAGMLTDLGYAVLEASSAEEALRLLKGGLAPDLLVTDHLMPGMTGIELAREVRTLRQGMLVLIVSGYAEMEGIAPDLPRLTKPFRQADLAASVAGLASGAFK